MATAGVLIQYPIPTCAEHEGEELSVLCLTCIRRICEFCLKNEHLVHDWSPMARVIREVRMKSKEKETTLTGILSDIKDAASESERKAETKRVDAMEARLISMIRDHANILRGELGEEGRDPSTEVTELEKTIHFFSHEVKDAHENVLFEMEEVFLKICQTHKTRKVKPKSSPKFKEGEITEEAIRSIFGKVIREDEDADKNEEDDKDYHKEEKEDHVDDRKRFAGKPKHTTDVKLTTNNDDERKDESGNGKKHDDTVDDTKRSVTEIAKFTHGTDDIRSIAPISATQAWIIGFRGKQTDCVDMNGRVNDVRKRDTYMTDFIVLENGDFIYTDYGNKTIYRELQSGKIEKLCSTSPFYPQGICKAHDGGILVCLSECNIPQKTQDSRGEIHHMELSGKIIRKYTRSEDGKTKLFSSPKRVAQNKDKDICVVDYVRKDCTNILVVLTVEGVVRFVYRGQSTLKGRFEVYDVCCDTYGRILVTDFQNAAVHQLSPAGQILQLLLTKQNFPQAQSVFSLALHGDTLWVGCRRGTVKVYNYH